MQGCLNKNRQSIIKLPLVERKACKERLKTAPDPVIIVINGVIVRDTVKEELRKTVIGLGADVCGFAAMDRFADAPKGFHPADLFGACRTVIVFGIALPKGLSMVAPRFIYGHFNDDVCHEIDRIAFAAAKTIESRFEGAAVPLPCDTPYEYWDADNLEGRGLMSMKHAAVCAGLGTLGKNTLLLNRDYGNMLIIGAVLTDLALASDPLAPCICKTECHLCIDSCPAGALDGTRANQKKCRTNTYGTTARGFGTVDCNICRTVCPRKYGIG